MVFRLGHSHLRNFTFRVKMRECESESAKLQRWRSKSAKTQRCEGESAKAQYYYRSFTFATLHSHLHTFAFFSLSWSTTYKLITALLEFGIMQMQLTYLSKVCRMLSDVFWYMHQLDSVAVPSCLLFIDCLTYLLIRADKA